MSKKFVKKKFVVKFVKQFVKKIGKKVTNSLDAGDAHQSQFLEAPLVREAEGELKNSDFMKYT